MHQSSCLSLMLITKAHPQFFQQIQMAVHHGVTIVQLRDKEMSDEQLFEVGQRLLHVLPKEVPLIVNDRVHVAAQLGVGVHLGQGDMPVWEARQILGPKVLIGMTIHHDVSLAQKAQQSIDYVGVGPVFATKTKLDTKSVLGLELLKKVCEESPVPVIAIGGIDARNAAEVRRSQPMGLAVCSGIMDSCNLAEEIPLFR